MTEINSTVQAISVLADVSDVLMPVFVLWHLQKSIASDIAPYVTRVTWSDNIKSESDTVEVELDDTDGHWLDKWYPGKGDTLTLKMGYQGEKLLSCGTFSIDEIEVSSPAPAVATHGVATSVNSALRTRSSRGFENTTLVAAAGRIVRKHRLKLVGSIKSIRIDRVTQYAETDVGFLCRLVSEHDYAVKVVSDQLIFSHLTILRSQESIKQLRLQDMARLSPRDTINRVYKPVKIKHQKNSSKKLIVYEADSDTRESDKKLKGGKVTSADSSKANSHVSDPGSARIKTDSALARHNEYQQNGSLTPTGTPQLTTGNKIELVGFGQLFGPWLIATIRHASDRNSGYTTELEVARGPATRGKKQKIQKLTVYYPDGSTSTVIKKKKKWPVSLVRSAWSMSLMPTGFRPVFVCLSVIACAQTDLACCDAIPRATKITGSLTWGSRLRCCSMPTARTMLSWARCTQTLINHRSVIKISGEPDSLVAQSTATTGRRTLRPSRTVLSILSLSVVLMWY